MGRSVGSICVLPTQFLLPPRCHRGRAVPSWLLGFWDVVGVGRVPGSVCWGHAEHSGSFAAPHVSSPCQSTPPPCSMWPCGSCHAASGAKGPCPDQDSCRSPHGSPCCCPEPLAWCGRVSRWVAVVDAHQLGLVPAPNTNWVRSPESDLDLTKWDSSCVVAL